MGGRGKKAISKYCHSPGGGSIYRKRPDKKSTASIIICLRTLSKFFLASTRREEVKPRPWVPQ